MTSFGLGYSAVPLNVDNENVSDLQADLICPKADCRLEFKEGLDLLRHQVTEGHFHQDKICKLCDKKFTRLYDLKRHILSVHENITFQCPHCAKLFKRLDTFKTHQAKAHQQLLPNFLENCIEENDH